MIDLNTLLSTFSAFIEIVDKNITREPLVCAYNAKVVSGKKVRAE